MLDPAMLKLILLVAVIPLALVGAVHLAVRMIRFVRANRGKVIASLLGDDLQGRIGDALESWVDEPVSGGSSHHSDTDHHSYEGDHSGHDH